MPCNCRQGTALHNHLGDALSSEGVFGLGAPINEAVDLTALQVWNCKNSAEEAGRIFNPNTSDNSLPICSDDDQELLIFAPLNSLCRVKGLTITGPANDCAPSRVKIFVNTGNITGFDSVQRLAPQEMLQLAEGGSEDRIVYRVNPGKFASVSSLAFLFDESFNGEETDVLRIELFGENSGKSTQQQVATNIVYEGRGNPADHRVTEEKNALFEVR
ncbi:hypothetical protein ABB37_08355 [Leptomonas pyrrhocoris]|uniref:PITH domain-containing protein n=1 Tax=Leptomonas pyrrhocoris TaxID=157538 RepID=A0A0M9FTR2_LEPPY|nr:hypothetical protein ABB37_08355 [Leptomonas pyrrhocoris]KPA75843.1 hypothetical protein ABB37_08355 [Leptomonas pyrrhocoris]|eukprot:XP_015654282.1 hypothetical protein ABB37_08355 [Leptomonas pyrrhocoris]